LASARECEPSTLRWACSSPPPHCGWRCCEGHGLASPVSGDRYSSGGGSSVFIFSPAPSTDERANTWRTSNASPVKNLKDDDLRAGHDSGFEIAALASYAFRSAANRPVFRA
jgi:hypothetical protein